MSHSHAKRLVVSAVMSATLLCAAGPARAQDQERLTTLLLDLLARSSENTTNAATGPTIIHEPHFLPGLSLKLAPRELNKAIALQLTTFPLPSSAGGFSYTTDPTTGEVRLATSTFGPIFAERALTIGKRRFDFGLAFQPTSFDSFEGAELSGGNVKFYLQHNNCCPGTPPGSNAPSEPTAVGPTPFTPEFERDLLESKISLDIETNTAVFFANYGLTDRLDIGAAVPVVTVRLGGAITSTLVRTATAANPAIHNFDGVSLASLTASETRSATGLGDILLRGKYNFVRSEANALAASIDLRLPTGDEDELLGTGATQTKLQLIASGEYGIFAPHASFGYTFSNGNVSELTGALVPDADLPGGGSVIAGLTTPATYDTSVPDEVNYTFGFSAAPHPRVTVGFDFIGRTIRDVFRFEVGNESFPNRAPGAIPTAAYEATGEFLVKGDQTTGTPQNLNLLLGVVGGKINIGRGLLVSAGVLFPLSDSGLQPNVTPFVGFDYMF